MNAPACRLCGEPTRTLFRKRVLNHLDVDYHQCATCGLTQTDEPTWLDEAYASPIAGIDTGLLARNLHARRVAAVFLHLAGVGSRTCLDWAGGYGVFTRLMRDIGFDFRWQDPYCENLMARGFEWDAAQGAPFACTAFEVLEHLPRPVDGFRELASLGADYIITSTRLHAGEQPAADWIYLAPESGQHVAFYRHDTIERLGAECGYPFVLTTRAMQLFARNKLPTWAWVAAQLPGAPLYSLVRRARRSLTESDSARLSGPPRQS